MEILQHDSWRGRVFWKNNYESQKFKQINNYVKSLKSLDYTNDLTTQIL